MAPESASAYRTTTQAHTSRGGGTARTTSGSRGTPTRLGFGGGHGGAHGVGVARQIKEQRRGYARAVLRAVARSHQGRPAAGIQRAIKQALVPLGVRLSPAQLRELAAHIEAGRPAELP
jgi:hypothetical protein